MTAKMVAELVPARAGERRCTVSVRRLFDQEFDGNAHELFSGTALVDPRQPLYVLPAEKLRQLETGQAAHVLHSDELEAGLPEPGHASKRVRDRQPLPLITRCECMSDAHARRPRDAGAPGTGIAQRQSLLTSADVVETYASLRVDALLGVDDQDALELVDAVDRANVDARSGL